MKRSISAFIMSMLTLFLCVAFLSDVNGQQGQEELKRQLTIIAFDEEDDAIIDCSPPGETCVVRLPKGPRY